jgi:hypothetical protein
VGRAHINIVEGGMDMESPQSPYPNL